MHLSLVQSRHSFGQESEDWFATVTVLVRSTANIRHRRRREVQASRLRRRRPEVTLFPAKTCRKCPPDT
eukprot:15471759-Alexandrium_andersonii.AAC.1